MIDQERNTPSNKVMEEIPPSLSTLTYLKLGDPDYVEDPSAEKRVPEFLADEIKLCLDLSEIITYQLGKNNNF